MVLFVDFLGGIVGFLCEFVLHCFVLHCLLVCGHFFVCLDFGVF